MKKKSTSWISPDVDSHELRALRANYQAYVWLNFESPNTATCPFNNGWQIYSDTCVPIRYNNPAPPQNMNKLSDQAFDTNNESDE